MYEVASITVTNLMTIIRNTNQRIGKTRVKGRCRYQKWDQVLRGSKHPLSTDHTRREPNSNNKKGVLVNHKQSNK
jgi:predicted nucleic acid-binding Zn ribbon protein